VKHRPFSWLTSWRRASTLRDFATRPYCRLCATCNQGSVLLARTEGRLECSVRRVNGGFLKLRRGWRATGLGGVSLTISTTGYLPGKDSCVLQVLARGAVSIDEEEKLPFAVEVADDVGTLFRYCLL
jgi:hypothetical protein